MFGEKIEFCVEWFVYFLIISLWSYIPQIYCLFFSLSFNLEMFFDKLKSKYLI